MQNHLYLFIYLKRDNMKNIVLIIALLIAGTSCYAGNPGKSALYCVNATTNSKSSGNLIFTNNCNHKVFVVWCGDLKWSKKTCGDGKNNSFYTHSANIAPGAKHDTTLKDYPASYKYAACKGQIGFGSKGIIHKASSNGSYTCTKTGSGY